MKKLFEKKIGAYFQSSVIRTIPNLTGDVWASWPMSTLALYEDRLMIKVALKGEFTLLYSDIDFIEKKSFGIQIHHTDSNIKPFVYINGFGTGSILFKQIVRVINDNQLKIKVAE